MQDQILSGFPPLNVQFPEQEQLRCPRCDSNNTKFCYYNNYNLSQPRHFCKSCKRYWTKGGTLRNIPVGGGCRKSSKRPRVTSPPPPPPTESTVQPSGSGSETVITQGHQAQNPSLKVEAGPVQTLATGPASGESFTSLLGMASKGEFGHFVDGFGHHDVPKFGPGQDSGSELVQGSISEANCWVNYNNNGWPDLVINTTNPGSKLQ